MPVTFSTTHGELMKALDAMTALNGRPITPAVGAVQITVSDGEVNLRTFDFTTLITITLDPATSTGQGQYLVARDLFTGFVRSFLAGSTKTKQAGLDIRFEVTDGGLKMSADSYEYLLPLLSDLEFPDVDIPKAGVLAVVDRDAMLSMVTRLQASAGNNATLPMLMGISIANVDGGLELATTDRFRLSVGFVGCRFLTTKGDINLKVLVPAKELGKLLRFLPAGEITCHFDGGWAVFTSGPMTIMTKWIDSEFVRYRSLIPSEGAGEMVVSRGDLAVAVVRASAAVDRGHHVRFAFADSQVQVSAGHEDGTVRSPSFRGEQTGQDMPSPIAFNPTYFKDALAMFSSDSVAIRYQTPARPVLIAEPGELNNPRAFRTLLMPARLPG